MKVRILLFQLLLIAVVSLALTPIVLEKNNVKFIYMQEWLTELKPEKADAAIVIRGVDGDTIKILLKGELETVRLIGVDTPESVHPKKHVQYFGLVASQFTKKIMHEKDGIVVTYDKNPRDRYHRVLGYVWFPVVYENKMYWVMHNLVLVVNGYGRAYTRFKFNREYMQIFVEAEQYAKNNKLGLWSSMDEKEAFELLNSGQIVK